MRNKKFCEKKRAGKGNTRCDPNPNSRTYPTKHYCKVDAQEDRGGQWDGMMKGTTTMVMRCM